MNVWIACYMCFAGCFGGFALGHSAAQGEKVRAREIAWAVIFGYLWPLFLIAAMWTAHQDARRQKAGEAMK